MYTSVEVLLPHRDTHQQNFKESLLLSLHTQWNVLQSTVAPRQFLNNPANCDHTTPTVGPKHDRTLISKVSSFQEGSTVSVHELKSHKKVFSPLLIEVAYQ